MGAAALDLCAVAGGRFDAYLDCSPSAHGAWDYLGGMLVCQEAGALVVDAFDRPLATIDHGARRTPIAAATPELAGRLRGGPAELHRLRAVGRRGAPPRGTPAGSTAASRILTR